MGGIIKLRCWRIPIRGFSEAKVFHLFAWYPVSGSGGLHCGGGEPYRVILVGPVRLAGRLDAHGHVVPLYTDVCGSGLLVHTIFDGRVDPCALDSLHHDDGAHAYVPHAHGSFFNVAGCGGCFDVFLC